jgi:aryl-alcohol dehydrogenase (NADP+)
VVSLGNLLSSKYKEQKTKFNAFEVQLAMLQERIQAGKIWYIGFSNKTPYGVCSLLAELAKQFPDLYPKIVLIQNSYSLVVRKDFEAGLTKACYHHKVGLLQYSPLASGTLSGKYRNKENSPNGQLLLFPGYMEWYLNRQNEAAMNAYCNLASPN